MESKTGMVMNLEDLKRYIKDAVFENLDHKNVDLDVEYFKDRPSTVENMVVYIWKQLKSRMQEDGTDRMLHKVKLWETDKNYATYKGE